MRKAWIYQRPSGKYDVYYWQGKRKTWAGGIPSKRLATQALNVCIQRINTAVFGNQITMDLQTAKDEFLKKYKIENAPASYDKTVRALNTFFNFSGYRKLSDYKNTDFLEFTESRKEKVSDSTVRYELTSVKGFFKYCKASGYIDSIPETPNVQPSRTKQSSHISVNSFVNFCSMADPDTRLACIVGLVTALRTMDVRGLTDRNIKGHYIETIAQKTQKEVKCYLPPILRDMLSGFKGFQKLSQHGFQNRVIKYSTGWTFHDLRRTHAQLMREFDTSLIFAQKSLQHSSVKVTSDFYATSNAMIIDRVFTPILERIKKACY